MEMDKNIALYTLYNFDVILVKEIIEELDDFFFIG
jgi:hypothetical protein